VTSRRLRWPPTTESLFIATIVLFGFRLGAHAIGDNSMFAHLRTGIDMAHGSGIPRTDPYSFTAHGHPWVVQSWLAELSYGLLYRLGGLRLVILEQALLMAALALAVVALARAGSPLRTALSGSVAVAAGAAYWTQRPLLFGLLALALTVLAVERNWNPWWLVPITWVWVNTHGSFPLGVAYLVARVAGEWLDDRRVRPPTIRHLGTFVVGLLVGAINPLGPKLLTFAFEAGQKREVFRDVTEWRSPNFQHLDGFWTLAFLAVALLILFRRRVPWCHSLPIVGFLALGLFAVRNISPAAIVLAPALGAAMQPGGSATPSTRSPVNVAFAGVLAIAFVLFAVAGTSGRTLDVHDYPVAAVRWLEQRDLLGVDARVAHNDVVGDYLILRNGRKGRVFADDRFDMYPVAVSRDLTTLIRGGQGSLKILDRYRIDTVVWDASAPLPELLTTSGKWREAYKKDGWAVLRRS
jgi:hypothetical protein